MWTQGVAALALGCVLHWAFSPPLLNPKPESDVCIFCSMIAPCLNAFALSGRHYISSCEPRVSLRLPWAMCSIGPLLTSSAAAQQFKQAWLHSPCTMIQPALAISVSPRVQGVTDFHIARGNSNSKPQWNCPLVCKELQTFVLHAVAPTQSLNGYVHILPLFAIEKEVERELIFAV